MSQSRSESPTLACRTLNVVTWGKPQLVTGELVGIAARRQSPNMAKGADNSLARAYLTAHAAKQHEKHFGWKTFRVLTVTTEQHRMQSMMEALRKLRVTHSPGAPLFFFTTRDELRASRSARACLARRQRSRHPTELGWRGARWLGVRSCRTRTNTRGRQLSSVGATSNHPPQKSFNQTRCIIKQHLGGMLDRLSRITFTIKVCCIRRNIEVILGNPPTFDQDPSSGTLPGEYEPPFTLSYTI